MDKRALETFINKYYLSGLVESAEWTATQDSLTARFRSADKTLVGFVSTKTVVLPKEGMYYIYDTSRLKAMLNVLAGPEVACSVVTRNDAHLQLVFREADNSITYALSDAASVSELPKIKREPTYPLHLKLDEAAVNQFLKARGAMNDEELFTLTCDGNDAYLIFGYSKNNTSQISLKMPVEQGGVVTAIHFSADSLKQVLLTNKNVLPALLRVSPEGLLLVTFTDADITANYYISQSIVK